jgi:chemotaxis signal transduction protein
MFMKAVVALSRVFTLPPVKDATQKVANERWRGLRIGNLALLVPHDCGGEVLEAVRFASLPHTRSWCRGLINLRGRIIPAFDLHEFFRLVRRNATNPWLVLGSDDEAVAFPIDALPLTLSSSNSAQIQGAALPDSLRAFISVGYRIDDELWLKFDHRAFFRALTPQIAA